MSSRVRRTREEIYWFSENSALDSLAFIGYQESQTRDQKAEGFGCEVVEDAQEWRDDSAEVLVVQEWGPEFDLQNVCDTAWLCVHTSKPSSAEAQAG